MSKKREIEDFLKELKTKVSIFDLLVLDDRGKNSQSLLDLEIIPSKRKEIIKSIIIDDYSEGPLEEKMRGILPMWVFGKMVKGKEVYIKISLGVEGSNVICISFHIAEHAMSYPYKN